jgi:hypothetical protein
MGMGNFFGRVRDTAQQQPGSRTETSGAGFLYEKQKRQLAVQLGVDPYSDNQVLQNLLNEIARHRAFGQLSAKVGTFFVPGGAGIALTAVNANTTIQALQQDIVEKSSAELQRMNRDVLTALGIPAHVVNSFLTHRFFSPTDQTVMTRSLQQLAGVRGIQQYLESCLNAPSVPAAKFQDHALLMAAAYHARVGRLSELLIANDTPFFRNPEGVYLGFRPVDYVYWAPRLPRLVESVVPAGSGRKGELWITGRVSERAAEEFAKRSIKVVQEAAKPLQLRMLE